MNKIANLISTGEITVEELSNAKDLIERAQFVVKALEACKRTILFPLGVTEISCYSFMDSAGEYEAWGSCKRDGTFTCSCNWGRNHVIGHCNLMNFAEVFMAFENEEFARDLKRFLSYQIEKENANKK